MLRAICQSAQFVKCSALFARVRIRVRVRIRARVRVKFKPELCKWRISDFEVAERILQSLAVDWRSTTKGLIITRSRSAICTCQVLKIVPVGSAVWPDLTIKT